MKNRSIKFKITCWYTCIMLLVFFILLGGTLTASEYYSEDNIKEELHDEIEDLQEELLKYPEYFPDKSLTSYYDDGVMLSIYEDDGSFINGVLPDAFPENISHQENLIRKVQNEGRHWFLDDHQVTMMDGSRIWIRGIYSFSSIAWMIQRLTFLTRILFPLLIFLTAFVGYRMIQRSLHPIQEIISTADTITASGALSTRLPMPSIHDELYDLSATFNRMFDSLEEHFQREQQLSSNAAHELRTPVSVMLSRCEYCLEELELSDAVREELKQIRQKLLQMSDLITSLLEITRRERASFHPDFEEIDLPMLAESASEELEEKAAQKDIRIHVSCDLHDPVITADMGMITRLFINMIDNAIHYGKEHGFIQIRLKEQDDRILIEFEDNGIGIPVDAQQQIWDRFYQVDSSSSGFGLGLPLVKQIIDCHHGTISVSSIPGRGTLFSFLLPRHQA